MNIEDILVSAAASINEEFAGLTDTEELFSIGKELLPLHPDNIKWMVVKGTIEKFKARIVCVLPSSLSNFIDEYNIKNGETIRIERSRERKKDSDYLTDR